MIWPLVIFGHLWQGSLEITLFTPGEILGWAAWSFQFIFEQIFKLSSRRLLENAIRHHGKKYNMPLCTPVSVIYIIEAKYSLTPQKLQQKVSKLILVGLNILFNILKVYQSLTSGKVFFARWLPKPLNGHNSVTTSSKLMILVSIPRFWGQGTHANNFQYHWAIYSL